VKLFYADHFVLPLPPGHRFPMEKYSRLRMRLLASTQFRPDDLHVPQATEDTDLLRAHASDYLQHVVSGTLGAAEQRRIGFPWSPEMVERSRRSVGATLAACRTALSEGCAANLAGGTHHAHREFGSGFCVFNDAAVAALTLRAENRVRKVAIVDCDVHQGDGTASILADDPDLLTFSIHGEKNFPFRKAHSDVDIALPDGTGDEAYVEALNGGLDIVFDAMTPDLVIYLAGADPYRDDRFGRLSLSFDGLRRRDAIVLDRCLQRKVPVAIAMAGGYARNIDDTVAIHASTLFTAASRLGAIA
jgi:acetoin utilization deacetylase AcuC-like enzyme